jgi:hypothetical protein
MLRIRVRWYRLNMTVGRQDADVPRQHDHRENEKPPPGNHDAVSHQPHWTNSTRLAMTVKRRGDSGPANQKRTTGARLEAQLAVAKAEARAPVG